MDSMSVSFLNAYARTANIAGIAFKSGKHRPNSRLLFLHQHEAIRRGMGEQTAFVSIIRCFPETAVWPCRIRLVKSHRCFVRIVCPSLIDDQKNRVAMHTKSDHAICCPDSSAGKRAPLCADCVPGVKLIIPALLRNQLIVGAAFNDAALFQNHDAVCVADG